MKFSFICLLFGTVLSTGAYADPSCYRLAGQQDIDYIKDLKAHFQSSLVKELLEALMAHIEDSDVAAFVQSICELQAVEVTTQSQSVHGREINEMRVLVAAYQSLPEESKTSCIILLPLISVFLIARFFFG